MKWLERWKQRRIRPTLTAERVDALFWFNVSTYWIKVVYRHAAMVMSITSVLNTGTKNHGLACDMLLGLLATARMNPEVELLEIGLNPWN